MYLPLSSHYRFYPCGWADDGIGLELVIEPWKEGLWDALKQHLDTLATLKKSQMKNSDEEMPLNVPTAQKCSKSVIGDEHVTADTAVVTENEKKNSEKVVDSEITLVKTDTMDLSIQNSVTETSARITEEVSKTSEISSENIIKGIENLRIDDTSKLFVESSWRENHVLLQLSLATDAKLTIPKIPTYNNLTVDMVVENETQKCCIKSQINELQFPFAETPPFECRISKFTNLTNHDTDKEVKKTVEIVMDLPDDTSLCYEPGDSIGILATNSDEDVQLTLQLLGITSPDQRCHIAKSPSAKRPLLAHLPQCSTLREILTSYVDLRCFPKKAMLLYLLGRAVDLREKRCLQELVSKEGAESYRLKVLENRLTFLDLLTVFSSCQPSVSAMLEFLPRLLPRAYSLTSSPLKNEREISFAYNLVTIPKTDHTFTSRFGRCTGKFSQMQITNSQEDNNIKFELSAYLRNAKAFRLPVDPEVPIILIGPGTGVAPLVGFLRHRALQIESNLLSLPKLGASWLFFGCRYPEADELYKDELEGLVSSRVLTHLRVCFSRVEEPDNVDRARYVQDLLREESSSLAHAITEERARVYVCGDAAHMAKDVHATLASIVGLHLEDAERGLQYIEEMQKEKRYLQDVWT